MTRQQKKAVVEDIINYITAEISNTEFDPTPIRLEDLDLNQIDSVDSSKILCINFRNKGDVKKIGEKEIIMNFGNMISDFEFSIPNSTNQNIRFKSSETAYISGIYSDNTPICLAAQEELIKCNNGLFAKKKFRYRDNEFTQNARTDWEDFNVDWMKYVIWCKICTNENFKELLLSTPDNSLIVEDTSFQIGEKRLIWGAENHDLKMIKLEKLKELKARLMEFDIPVSKKIKQQLFNSLYGCGAFTGKNLMGKTLTSMRIYLRNQNGNGVGPDINYELLNSKEIFLLGQKLVFE